MAESSKELELKRRSWLSRRQCVSKPPARTDMVEQPREDGVRDAKTPPEELVLFGILVLELLRLILEHGGPIRQ
jgi:hypothetical protein